VGLTVLSVAYPFAPVSQDTAGGAEQVLSTIDRALTGAGHRSLVMAMEGSNVAGTLIPMPTAEGEIDDAVRARIHAAYADVLAGEITRRRVDVVHMHGIDFHAYLPPPGPPVLATLHLPISWYPTEALHPWRPRTFLHGVSAAQHRDGGRLWSLPPIENGIDVEAYTGRHAKRRFALMLARICPEKGVHLALDAARAAGVPLLVAGEVFPYAAHRRYFEEEVKPRLDNLRRYIGPVGGARKKRLLAAARCVVVASTVPETSSLVAREAMAAGTPVVALARGALPETIVHGRTGFLVEDVKEMAAAILRAGEIDPEICRGEARRRFSHHQMIARYFNLYRTLARSGAQRLGDAA
jgi:glycosyltransferase involved in cell wall biosynthesis